MPGCHEPVHCFANAAPAGGSTPSDHAASPRIARYGGARWRVVIAQSGIRSRRAVGRSSGSSWRTSARAIVINEFDATKRVTVRSGISRGTKAGIAASPTH